MKSWYIKETDYPCGLFNKIVLRFKKWFNIIETTNIDGKIVCIIPIHEKTRLRRKKVIKLAGKLSRLLYDNDIQNIVLSNYLETIELFKNKIYSENINILDGRILFNYLIYNIIEYIAKKKNKKIETLEVSILVNDNTDLNIENIMLIAQNVKKVNIMTNNIQKFRVQESYLYDELGIVVKLSNNKKKGIGKSDIIINIDFPNEMINNYTLPNNCIIINTIGNISINSKKFSGINANYFNIDIPEKHMLEGFKNETVYESIIYKNGNFDNIRDTIKKDEIKITNLIGNNGIINEKELEL